MSWREKIDLERLPVHIAIIMDGNGRWAKQRGKLRVFGHENGVQSVREVTEASAELGIKVLTLYAFSTENWCRPRWEVDALMELLVKTLRSEMKTLHDNNISLNVIGDMNSLNDSIRMELETAIEATRKNDRMVLNLALSYSSRWEIAEAAKKVAILARKGELDPTTIDAETLCNYFTTAGLPDPELLIRTSGEYRLSNFLLWQIAYTELYFTPKLWPDFRKEDLYEAIVDFQNRERRFGKTSDQLNAGINT